MNLSIPFKQTNVLKAVLVPFKEKDFIKPLFDRVFVIPVNPETYDEKFQVNNDTRNGFGQPATDAEYQSTSPRELTIDFFLDGTNTIDGYFYPTGTPVLAQVVQLRRTAYDIDGDIHRPNYLKLFWGSLIFCGVLKSMNINYTLFNPVGIPIRAKISLTLEQHESKKISALKQRLNSPDVTHIKDFKAGQRLDNLTHEIYNNSNLVLQVAKANKLTSFRNVKENTSLTFPPIDKQTK